MAAHRYWRIYVTSLQGGNVATSVREIQFRETSGGANVATGGTAIASGGSGVATAFDGNTGTSFTIGTAAPTWIGYDFGGTPRDITEFVWNGQSAGNNPSNMVLEWSDDAATWTPSFPAFGITGWVDNEARTFTQPNTSITTVVPSSPGSFLFIGGELEDFGQSGQTSNIGMSTTGTAMRAGYARASIYVQATGNYVWANFAPSAQFAATCRFHTSTSGSNPHNTAMMALCVGASPRLILRRTVATASATTLTLEKTDGTTVTSLGVSTATIAASVLYRLDILVDSYGAAGRVRVYINQVLYIDSGVVDVAAGGATALDRFIFYPQYTASSFTTYYSEVIVATEDTRPLSLVTLAPTTVGDSNTFTRGGWADIDEITASDTDVTVGDTNGQLLTVHTSGLPSTTLTPRAVKVNAVAVRGSTGPSRLGLGVRSGGANALNTAALLDTGYGIASAAWSVNPATGAAWTVAELEALQIAFRAET